MTTPTPTAGELRAAEGIYDELMLERIQGYGRIQQTNYIAGMIHREMEPERQETEKANHLLAHGLKMWEVKYRETESERRELVEALELIWPYLRHQNWCSVPDNVSPCSCKLEELYGKIDTLLANQGGKT